MNAAPAAVQDQPKLRLNGFTRLPSALTEGDARCQNCFQKGAKHHCVKCCVSDIGSIHTLYCSEACQKEHWDKHRFSCEQYRLLIRAVRTLAELWDFIAKLTYSKPLHCKSRNAKNLRLSCSDIFEDPSQGAWTGESIFRSFPESVVPNHLDQLAKDAFLYHGSGTEALQYGADLIEYLGFQRFCSVMTEATTDVKNRAIAVHVEPPAPPMWDGIMTGHFVLCVEVIAGQRLIIDLAGKQFGWQEAIYHWDHYMRHRGWIDQEFYFGKNREIHAEERKLPELDKIELTHSDVRQQVIQCTITAMNASLARRQLDIWTFLDPSTSSFETHQADVLTETKAKVEAYFYDLTVKQGIGRMFYFQGKDLRDRVSVVRSAGHAEALKTVWFTKKSVKRWPVEILREQWIIRMNATGDSTDNTSVSGDSEDSDEFFGDPDDLDA